MNIFRSLIGKVWQDPNATEVVKIASGQLFLVRPGNIRSSRECIYPDAMATVRRIPSVEHNFELVITKVYEDGEEDLFQDEDETDEEKVFLIGEELEFRVGETDGDPVFRWRDLSGDIDEMYEFDASATNAPTRAFFETCMYRAMYERKYRKNAEAVQDADLQEFIWKEAPAAKSPPRRKVAKKTSAPKPVQPSPPPAASSQGEPIDVDRVDEDQYQHSQSQPVEPTPVYPSNIAELYSEEAELYFWVIEEEGFRNDGVVTAKILRQTDQDYVYWLAATKDDKTLLLHEISPTMNERFSPKMYSLTWNHITQQHAPSSWLFKFSTEEDYARARDVFVQCQWETAHRMSWDKIKQDEQQYVMRSNEDVIMKDVDDESDEEDEVQDQLVEEEDSEEDEDEGVSEDEDAPAQLKGDKNSQLMVGYKGDRSYVVRGNNIGVFNHGKGSSVKYYATISNIATPKGKSFKPKHIMLHDQDTKMVIQNPGNPNSLFNLDIERGKIVEEWKVHDDIQVDHIAPDNKFAPTTREQTLVGASHNALFRIDPRVSGTKLVESQFKQYVSKNKFSGVATTSAGKLAVASEKGDIRLFDSIGKNAKTALPPLGDPIIGVDVTADGRYLVATTSTYLLVIDTLIGEGRYQGQLGFDRSFPATAKPQPLRLRLHNQHVAYMGGVSFTPAKFNMGEGQEENAIVTSSGQYVIAWDFKKVKKGKLDVYEIKKYEDHVVQDSFKFGDDKEIIVALNNNVLAVNKNKLAKPSRKSLGGPQAGARGYSSIVDAPY